METKIKNYSESEIQKILKNNFDHKYQLENSYVFPWESDYFGFTKSGYCYEIEIKLSRSDFFTDRKKIGKFIMLDKAFEKQKELGSNFICPNRFYYAVPEGLISIDEVPKYSGLIYIKNNQVEFVKESKFLHKNKILEQLQGVLLDKFYYKSIDLENGIIKNQIQNF